MWLILIATRRSENVKTFEENYLKEGPVGLKIIGFVWAEGAGGEGATQYPNIYNVKI